MKIEKKVLKILDALKEAMPGAKVELDFKTPLELLIATMLSAQCTDKRVNIVTPALFKRYIDAAAFADADQAELENLISSINFFRNKVRAIKAAATIIRDELSGLVPDNLEGLTRLPGVGRKTANIVLAQAFGVPAIGVDTHAKRVAARLGLTANTNPDKIEADLCALIPRDRWIEANTLIILHGRRTCKAKRPLCAQCPIIELCDFDSKVI
ncbi:Endonuclease III [hydrothermal vent metagenome]|uniref:Endonuclease III n=1 Tax=hydrothermal vent metagenome TaxID=652676 RepID=A0A3B0RCU6_9ZZZZ